MNIKRLKVYFAGSRYFENEFNARENSTDVLPTERTVVDHDGALFLLGEPIVPTHELKYPDKVSRRRLVIAKLTNQDLAILGLTRDQLYGKA